MQSVISLNHFYYIRNFTDMCYKYHRVLSIIREQLHRESVDGDVFIVMSRNRRTVQMFAFDNHPCSLFKKTFVSSYQFMKVERKIHKSGDHKSRTLQEQLDYAKQGTPLETDAKE